jgi:hypothetical protein
MVTERCTQSVSEGKLSFTEPLVKFAHRLTGVMGGWANTPDVFGVSASIRTVIDKVRKRGGRKKKPFCMSFENVNNLLSSLDPFVSLPADAGR